METSRGPEITDGVAENDQTQGTYDWTSGYKRWDGWEDPEEADEKREAEKKRLRNINKSSMACSHDHSEERKLMDMPLEEKVRLCHMYRRKGNLYHQEGQYRRAALQYRQALIRYDFCFPEEPSMQQELDSLRQTCLLNSAACFLRCRELDEVADCCYQVLQSDPDNVKALFRRAQVHRMRDNFQEAKEDIIRALQTKPDDYQLRKESAILKAVVIDLDD